MANYHILVINPGSTSTKMAVFHNRQQVLLTNIKHSQEQLSQFDKLVDQTEFRKKTILDELDKAQIDLQHVSIVVGRGGLLKPIEGGVYKVNEKMIQDIYNPMGDHESNLGCIIAHEIVKLIHHPVLAIIADPTCVDEMEPIAKLSGHPEISRRSFLHTLNQKAVARRFARESGKTYEELNLIVAHLGGGTSVGAHQKGRIIDVNNGLNGDGPYSPERSGGLPAGQLVDLCFSGKYSKEEIHRQIKGKGGLMAYLGVSNCLEIEKRIENGDANADLIYRGMAYQIAKEIGALSTVLKGEVDAILISGGVAYSQYLMNDLTERVKHIATVKIYPGEDEMEALAANGFMVLHGEIEAKEYS